MTDVEGGMSERGQANKGLCASLMVCGVREFGTDRSWGDRRAWKAMFAEFMGSLMLVFVACTVTITTTMRNGLHGFQSASRYSTISMALGFVSNARPGDEVVSEGLPPQPRSSSRLLTMCPVVHHCFRVCPLSPNHLRAQVYIGLQFTVLPFQGHINPAVSLAAALTGQGNAVPKKQGGGSNRLYLGKLVMFWMAQFAGSVIGATICLMVLPDARSRSVKAGLPSLNDRVSWELAFLSEIVLSCLFCWGFLVISYFRDTPKKTVQNNQPISAGLLLVLMQLVAHAVSGAALNPARFIGPALITGQWQNGEIYVFGPMVGAVLSAFMYTFFSKSKDVVDEGAEE